MVTLNIALLQLNIVWQNPIENRKRIEKFFNTLSASTDLVILPELFTTGFTMTPDDIAETMNGETLIWLKELAKKHNTAITGSLIIKESNNCFNRLVFVTPNQEICYYNKRHSFSLAGEEKVYTSGTTTNIIDYKGFKINTQICYDLRFPVWSRNTTNYDVLIYVANWPDKRIGAWNCLLQARAIENMCFTIGVNRVGKDPNNNNYNGHSSVYNELGEALINPILNTEGFNYTTLNKENLNKSRKHFGFLNDRDAFTLT